MDNNNALLTQCSTCGNSISREARSCPKCGQPTQDTSLPEKRSVGEDIFPIMEQNKSETTKSVSQEDSMKTEERPKESENPDIVIEFPKKNTESFADWASKHKVAVGVTVIILCLMLLLWKIVVPLLLFIVLASILPIMITLIVSTSNPNIKPASLWLIAIITFIISCCLLLQGLEVF